MTDPVLRATGLAARLDDVRKAPSREAWLLRLLTGAFVVLIVLVAVVVVFAVRIDRRADRTNRAEAARQAAATEQGTQVFNELADRINHIDTLVSDHVGQQPLPPLRLPTTTTTVRRSTAPAARRAASTTTTRPSAATTTTAPDPGPTASTTTSSSPPPSTTTTVQPRPCTTRPVAGCLPTDP